MTFCDFSEKFRALRALLATGAVLTSAVVAAAANSQSSQRSGLWAHETSALKPDPHVVWGRLDNGLRYALLPHRGVPGRVSVHLIVLTGSLDETDEEQGIAHYMEHMVFRSTANFSFEEKLRFFQQLGMEFGSDVNANTGHERTQYSLDFHDVTPELVSQGLRILRDFADGAKFLDAEIDKERGVVLSELRDDDNIATSNAEYTWPIIYKGHRAPLRFPIGKKETLRSFHRSHFVNFYQRCYRADLMVLVAAGDFDPTQLVALIHERFDSLARPTTPVPPRDVGKLDLTRALRAGVFAISNSGGATAQVACVSPPNDRPDSAEARAETLRRTIAMELVSRRLRALTGGEGSAQYVDQLGLSMAAVIATVSPDDWARDLGVMDDLVRFTAQKGFEPRELDVVLRRYKTATNYQLEQKDSVDPKGLADNLAESINENKVYTGFEAENRATLANLAVITPRNLQQSFIASWDFDRMVFCVTGQVDIEGGAAEVVKKVQEARKSGLRNFRPETRKETVFELKKWGTPTAVVETREIPELGAKLFRFGNNVRVNFVSNRAEAGQVHVLARVGTGLIDLPGNRPALKDYGLNSLISSGTANFTPEYISKVFEDHLSYLSIDLQDQDAFAFRSGAATDKIEIPLGIITDFLHRPLFNTAIHREVKIMAYMQRSMNSLGMGEAMRRMDDYLFRGDPRLTSGDSNDYIRLSAVDVRDWLEEPLRHGYVELTIAGDITEEAMLKAVTRTLGSLPTRDATKTPLAKPKPIKVTGEAGFQRLEFIGEQNLALVIGTWPVEARLNLRDKMALQIMSRILQDRVRQRLRSDLGLSYAPGADFEPFNGFGDFAVVRAHVACAPDDSTKIAHLLEDIGASLARDGIPAGEFEGAQHLLLGQMREMFRYGSFLLSVIKWAQEKPSSLDEVIALKNGSIGSITLEEVNTWAHMVLDRHNSRTAAIVPKPFIGILTPTQ